ncbi:MAG: sigma-54-dependent Fis family transcriptional regulator [Acidobacteriota bacterium]|nr:sigma-54-dependent Fis family transcriptional regulator [Acidobacteriota bacterium]
MSTTANMTEQVAIRTVVLASADVGLRQRLASRLKGLRWQVREAGGGAEAMAHLETLRPEAILLDTWLPDLEVTEFAGQILQMYPMLELLRVDGSEAGGASRSPRRNELLLALREAQCSPADTAAWAAAPGTIPPTVRMTEVSRTLAGSSVGTSREAAITGGSAREQLDRRDVLAGGLGSGLSEMWMLPEMIGASAPMQELARLIRMVAPRSTTVLIEGETGTGKEVVARALHRLSMRASRPFVVLNCAAIPEALLEAELFGHTRGAFTGAVQSRTGRIEAADGGTLFLDEIGEMPLALQAKMLRFLESGELQRVGDNDTVRVDVRVIAATHQPLEKRASEGSFRLDLYHRLAVFPVEVPPLRERLEDLPLLAESFLEQMGQVAPRKRLAPEALARLGEYHWPGNVRELMHVLERATILCAARPEITPEEIRLRRATRL